MHTPLFPNAKFDLHAQLPDGAVLRSAAGLTRLQVWDERILRVTCTGRERFLDQPSRIVLPRPAPPDNWLLDDRFEALSLVTPALRLQADRATGAFSWHDSSGNLLVREPDRAGRILRKVELPGRDGYSARLEFQFSEGEALYGLGQHEEGILNYRGHHQYLYQHNLKVALPVLVSSRGYGILFDTAALSIFHDDQHGSYFWTEAIEEFDFYFIYGPSLDQVVAGLRRLTGGVPMFPRWAYGYIQSKERYKTQAELLEIAKEYRQRRIPLDAIILDWKSWPGALWGQKTFDPERFPDPTQMMADLHRLNTRLMISVWPKFSNDGPNQVEMRQAGCLLGDGATYDAFNPQARALYWKQANEGLFRHGIDGWWCDCTEPFEPDWDAGPVAPEPEERLRINVEGARRYLDPAALNAYSLAHSQGMYEGQRAATSEKRVVNLTRSAFPGQQRYGTVTWSGDIPARWETLRRQIPAGLNFTITGNPRWTLDIGGFFVKSRPERWFWRGDFEEGCTDPGYRELVVRWMQYGAFLPMFRAHGTDTPREIWRFGQPGEPFYEALVKAIHLRYRLLPYIYSLAGWETWRDYTMLRALAFDFGADPLALAVSDEFMFGPALLVCPVTEPMAYGPNWTRIEGHPHTRTVYLPAGCSWYDFWSGKRYSGGQRMVVPTPLDRLPLYVRAGSILPLGPVVQYAGERPNAPLEVRIYPGASGRFDLYEDEGDSYRCEQGERAWTPLGWDETASEFSVGPREGSYRGMPERRLLRPVFVRPEHGVGLEEFASGETLDFRGENLRARRPAA